jgi:alkyl hydroperoxide reductase subunit AhpF
MSEKIISTSTDDNKSTENSLSREAEAQLASTLQQNIQRRLSLDVWSRPTSSIYRSDRDDARHGMEMTNLVRQITSLHEAISFTPYDIDTFAKRAEQDFVTVAPTIVARSAGHSIRLVGIPAGTLFPAFIDVIVSLTYLSLPLDDEIYQVIAKIESAVNNGSPVEVELFVTPYDDISSRLYGIFGVVAAATKSVRVTITEIAEFPILAKNRLIEQVPVVTLNGHRFIGVWALHEILHQILHIAKSEDEIVVREESFSGPYVSEDDALKLVSEQSQTNSNMTSSDLKETDSGLLIPR